MDSQNIPCEVPESLDAGSGVSEGGKYTDAAFLSRLFEGKEPRTQRKVRMIIGFVGLCNSGSVPLRPPEKREKRNGWWQEKGKAD
jgi:hypothetical protein